MPNFRLDVEGWSDLGSNLVRVLRRFNYDSVRIGTALKPDSGEPSHRLGRRSALPAAFPSGGYYVRCHGSAPPWHVK